MDASKTRHCEQSEAIYVLQGLLMLDCRTRFAGSQ